MGDVSDRSLRLWVVAGETSGDVHGGELLRGLRALLPGLEIEGVGGRSMQAEGLVSWLPFESLQVHGLVELLGHLPRLLRVLDRLEAGLRERQPHGLLLIDYPGLNLRLAQRAKRLGIPVWYYSGPQIWAWRPGRMRWIKEAVQLMVVLFPFEEDLYRQAGVEAHFLGHPLVGQQASAKESDSFKQLLNGWQGDVVALMPGSRHSELQRHLEPMLDAASLLLQDGLQVRFVLPLAEQLNQARLRSKINQAIRQRQLQNHLIVAEHCFLALLNRAQLAVIATGTATLQAALAQLPMVSIYRVHPLTFWLAKRIALQPHMCIVNILANETLVPELLQQQLTPHRIYQELKKLWPQQQRQHMKTQLKKIIPQLGQPQAYQRAAQLFAQKLQAQRTP